MNRLFQDHLGRSLELQGFPARRIVSLCPSQTETLFAMGLGPQVVGRTRFCIHPKPHIDSVLRVGGTKEVNFERIESLNPDLIIGEKEENTPEMVSALSERYPVYVTDVRDLPGALRMIRDLGELGGLAEKGRELAASVSSKLNSLKPLSKPLKCLYFIWREPWMVAGEDTFIHAMLELCGLENVAPKGKGRYPEVDLQFVEESGADLLLLSSEPYPFAVQHVEALQQGFSGEIGLVDGEMFSWYGSRLLEAPAYLDPLLRGWEHRFNIP